MDTLVLVDNRAFFAGLVRTPSSAVDTSEALVVDSFRSQSCPPNRGEDSTHSPHHRKNQTARIPCHGIIQSRSDVCRNCYAKARELLILFANLETKCEWNKRKMMFRMKKILLCCLLFQTTMMMMDYENFRMERIIISLNFNYYIFISVVIIYTLNYVNIVVVTYYYYYFNPIIIFYHLLSRSSPTCYSKNIIVVALICY